MVHQLSVRYATALHNPWTECVSAIVNIQHRAPRLWRGSWLSLTVRIAADISGTVSQWPREPEHHSDYQWSRSIPSSLDSRRPTGDNCLSYRLVFTWLWYFKEVALLGLNKVSMHTPFGTLLRLYWTAWWWASCKNSCKLLRSDI